MRGDSITGPALIAPDLTKSGCGVLWLGVAASAMSKQSTHSRRKSRVIERLRSVLTNIMVFLSFFEEEFDYLAFDGAASVEARTRYCSTTSQVHE
jgi:hypothetical protein